MPEPWVPDQNALFDLVLRRLQLTHGELDPDLELRVLNAIASGVERYAPADIMTPAEKTAAIILSVTESLAGDD